MTELTNTTWSIHEVASAQAGRRVYTGTVQGNMMKTIRAKQALNVEVHTHTGIHIKDVAIAIVVICAMLVLWSTTGTTIYDY
jgi:hypothetical protein